jgi:hypothetical protein
MNFIELNNLPIFDLKTELDGMLNKKVLHFKKNTAQICLNTVKGHEKDYHFGIGSLYYDWDKLEIKEDGEWIVPVKDKVYEETDFNVLCEQFVDTPFETVYNELSKKYFLGRVRIMKSIPNTCLSWHKDDHPRVHYPIQTQAGCFMVIEDKSMHLEQNKWYFTNTQLSHTAFNGSSKERIHLVATIVGEKNAGTN